MTTREAAIKLTLNPGTFQSGMRQTIGHAKSAGRAMGRALKEPMIAGLKSVRDEAKQTVASLKDGVKQVATLGGALSVGAGVKAAADAQRGYTILGGILSDTTGKAVSMADAQAAVGKAAGGANSALGDARIVMGQIAGQAKGIDDAADATERVLKQATRLGDMDPELVAHTFTRLKAKTHESNEAVEMMIESFARMSREMIGTDLTDALNPEDAAEYAGFVNFAAVSMEGAGALVRKVGGDIAKDMGMAGEFIEEIGNALGDSGKLAGMRKALKLTPADINASRKPLENMLTILEKRGGKGAEAVMAGFGNERNQKAIRKMLGGEAVILKAKKGDKSAQQTLVDRAKEMIALGNTQVDSVKERARIEKRNAAIAATASARFAAAQRKIEQAFSSPAMLDAVDKLADKLPILADKFAGLIEWVAGHPDQAAASLVLGKIGMVFGGSVVQAAASAGVKALFAQVLAANAATAASSVASKGASALGLGGAVAAGGAGTMAAMAAGVLGAGAAGYAGGTLFRHALGTDEMASDTIGASRSATNVAYQASRSAGGSASDRKAALASIAKARADLADKKGWLEDTMSGLATGTGLAAGSSTGEQRTAAVAKLDAAEARIKAANQTATKQSTDAMNLHTAAVKRMTGGSSRGPGNAPPSMPGVE